MNCLLVLVLLVVQAVAWGPITHYDFSCRTLTEDPCACFQNASLLSLLLGSDTPDAFYFGVFTDDNCQAITRAVHDGKFAGHQILYALESGNNDFLLYAKGFASHIVADVVGFYFSPTIRGYLSDGTQTRWINEWPFMTAVDALVYRNLTKTCQKALTLPTLPLSANTVAFLASSTQRYHQVSAPFPALNATEVSACTDMWASVVNGVNAKALSQGPDCTLQELVLYDRYGAKTADQALQHLNMAGVCVDQALQYYFETLLNRKASPEVAFEKTFLFVSDLFAKGECAPTSNEL